MTLLASKQGHLPISAVHQTGEAGASLSQSPVDIHGALTQVQQLQEFAVPKPGLWDDWSKLPWLKKWAESMSNALESFFDSLVRMLTKLQVPGTNHLPENIKDLFSGFISFVLVLMGLFALYLLLGWILRVTEPRQSAQEKDAPRIFDEALLVSARYHREQAHAFADKGCYAEGIRQYYLALLCFLDESKLVPFSATLSNEEYAASLLAKGAVANALAGFRGVALPFEVSRYGQHPVEAIHYRQVQACFEQLEKAYQPHA